MRLLAEIDGQAVPMDACDWVLWAKCGCAMGVTVARLAPTEDDAWRAFWSTKRERERKARAGYRVELVTHERWNREICDLMRGECPHVPDQISGGRSR